MLLFKIIIIVPVGYSIMFDILYFTQESIINYINYNIIYIKYY